MGEIENYDPNWMTINKETRTLINYRGSKRNRGTANVPYGVEKIGNAAFAHCKRFDSVRIPNTVKAIGNRAFYDCPRLTSIRIPGSVLMIGEKAFGYCENLREVILGECVISISDYAFTECTALTSVVFPDSLQHIGRNVFYGCKGITSIRIPKSTELFFPDLMDLPTLESFTIDEDNQRYTLVDDVLLRKDMSELIRYPIRKQDEIYIVPDKVKTIKRYSFDANNYLKEVVIPYGAECIEERAFAGCINLTVVTIPESVTEIGYCAFIGCRGVRNRNFNYRNLSLDSSVSEITSTINSYSTMEGVVIRGRKGSVAHQYAQRNGCPFIELQ